MNTIVILIIIIIVIALLIFGNTKTDPGPLIENSNKSIETELITKNIETCIINEDCKEGICFNGYCIEKPKDIVECINTSCNDNVICVDGNLMIYDNINKSFYLLQNWWVVNKCYCICEGIIENTMFILSKNGIYINKIEKTYDLKYSIKIGENKIDEKTITSIFTHKNILYCVCNNKIYYGLSQRELLSNQPIKWELLEYLCGRDITNEHIINVTIGENLIDIETPEYHLRHTDKWHVIEDIGKFIYIDGNRYSIIRDNQLYLYNDDGIKIYNKIVEAAYDKENDEIIVITLYKSIKILSTFELLRGKGEKLFSLYGKVWLISNNDCQYL